MHADLNLLPYIQINLVVFLMFIIYIVWAKIPSRQKQREKGEKIIAESLPRHYEESRKKFRNYFRDIFIGLVLISLLFFFVNALIALAINIFLASQGVEFMFFGDLPLPTIPRSVVAIIVAFMMCIAGWLIMISLFYHNRAVKRSLEIKYEGLFRES